MTDDLAAALARAERAEAELAKLREPNVARPTEQIRYFRAADLRDVTFYRANKDEIARAMKAGRIIPDTSYAVPGATSQAQREAARKAATR